MPAVRRFPFNHGLKMKNQKKSKSAEKSNGVTHRKSIWRMNRQQSIDYQRAAQMTWWSILQGLAVAALSEKTYDIFPNMLTNKEWFYLFYILTSALVIVSSWVQMSWAIILQRWPVNVTHTSFTLLLGITIYLMALYVDQSVNWFRALLAVIISAIVIYIYNLKTEAVLDLPRSITIRTIATYIFYGVICLIASFHIKSSMTIVSQAGWGFLIFILAMTDWMLQSKNIKEQNKRMDIPE